MPQHVLERLRNLANYKKKEIREQTEEEPEIFEKQKKVIKKLRKYTKHKFIRVTERGNSAIFSSMFIAKKKNPKPHLLIPDQGGWITFKKYAQFFNFNVKEVKTNYGIIDLDDLKEKTQNASALAITSFAGYFAAQPLEAISKICKANGCLLIEDASGAIGDKKLCNGKYSDIIVGSFCKHSSINLGYGGFISTSEREYIDAAKEPLSLTKIHPNFYKELLPFLNRERFKSQLELAEKVKRDLKKRNFRVIHEKYRGVNVAVHFDTDLIVYCNKRNFPYILCPNYIRVNEKAVSIELKRLENEFLEKNKGKKF